MLHENGKSIYNKFKLSQLTEEAKNSYNNRMSGMLSDFLKSSQKILKEANTINDVLMNEAICLDIFDSNLIKSNISKINNKLVACRTAIRENNFFQNDKQGYLNEFKESRIKNISADSAFEKATKELILYLGNEKRTSLMNEEIYNYYEIRQDKIREITQEFKKERISFLEKHIPQEQNQSVTKSKNKQFER